MLRIKICGITRVADAQAAVRAGVHALGINLVPESSRYIRSLDAAEALVAQAGAPERLWWAGVFVNPPPGAVLEAVARLGLRIVQLHGEETPAFVQELKKELPPQVALWKAQRVGAPDDLARLEAYACDGWLVDAQVRGLRGGSGRTFDWSLLKTFKRAQPLILSGGLTPVNVAAAVRQVAPDWVDVASGVESSPGVKDQRLLSAFVQAARTAIADGG